MANMPLLRITQYRENADIFHVEVAFESPHVPRQTATSKVTFELTNQEHEQIRWYLEDYLQFPQDPSPMIAGRIEQRMAEIGKNLFKAVFHTSENARDLWVTVRSKLNDTRVEVVTSVEDATTIPWELLRDPKADACLALNAISFVRAHPQGTKAPKLPSLSGEEDAIRILLVICRPRKDEDVPFRSVASRLIMGLTAETHQRYQLDMLRPATYTYVRLAEVLRRAKANGKPYHIVHFDGHGMYADINKGTSVSEWLKKQVPFMLSSQRTGSHGYLLFENPEHDENTQLVDGPSLGELLVETDVPVLVLNSCRSAYADPKRMPNSSTEQEAEDPHAKVRALGSLAQEVMDAGVAGVVAMRYNVYVVTAAHFVADLYETLMHGQTLGEAVTMGRKQLAADPLREIAFEPVPLQDWCVPVVYEAAPIRLFRPKADTDKMKFTIDTGKAKTHAKSLDPTLPKRPDAGFYGRDETLLALDRAFDSQSIVLLYALAGSGKTATAAEFARWYVLTGGLDGGPVLFTSFEQYTPLRTVLGHFGQMFAPTLEQSGINWLAITNTSQMRDIALQVMRQIPILWIWDNVEPVAGFPKGTNSEWKPEEKKELVDFLRDARDTRAKFLLTSRRDERDWLGDLPVKISIPPMPMQERVQLSKALAEKHGCKMTMVEAWRPLLVFTQGNPLTLTVLVGQALLDKLRSIKDFEAFVEKLRAGEACFQDEAAEGRSRSLAASLNYGFDNSFSESERRILALLHFFQGCVNVDVLRTMGHEKVDWSVPELRGLSREHLMRIIDRAAEIGLLTAHGGGLYSIHPALPWFFQSLFEDTYEKRTGLENVVTRAFVGAMTDLARVLSVEYERGNREIVGGLQAEEKNLLHARRLARALNWSDSVIRILMALNRLYDHTGRHPEWRELVDEILPDYLDPITFQPQSGHESDWGFVAQWRVHLDIRAMKWEEAERLQLAELTWARERATEALKMTPEKLDASARDVIGSLGVSLATLGQIQLQQRKIDCVPTYEEAMSLMHKIGNKSNEAKVCQNLGVAYMDVPRLRNLTTAEDWFKRGIGLLAEHDRLGRGKFFTSLGNVAYERFREARDLGCETSELLQHLNKALGFHQQALVTLPRDAVPDLATSHNQLGLLFSDACEYNKALSHYQEAIKYSEIQQDYYGAARSRANVANTLARIGRYEDAMDYAHAALGAFSAFGPSAKEDIRRIQELIRSLQDRLAGSGGKKR